MVSPGSAYAASDMCNTMEKNLGMLSSGGYLSYLVQCTDFDVEDIGASSSGVLGSQTIVAAGANTKINADPPGAGGGSNTQSEVSIDSCGNSVVSGYNDSEQFAATASFTGYSQSQNGGTTWTDAGVLPLAPGGVGFGSLNGGDPSVKADSDCNFFFATLVTFPVIPPTIPPTADSAIGVSVSGDGGVTFGTPVIVARSSTDFLDKELLGVGPNPAGGQDIIHVSFTRFSNDVTIEYWRSLDGGATWQDQFTFNPGGSSQGSIPVVDPNNGDVYVFYKDFAAQDIKVSRNSNGGAPGFWGPLNSVAPVNNIGSFNDNCGMNGRFVWNGDYRFSQFPTGAVNPQNGDIYVSWNDAGIAFVGTTTDIVVYRSQNQGNAWAQVASPAPTDPTTDQYIPWMDTTPSGEIKMIWYDRINDANNLATELFASSSKDGGTTWQAPFLVSTAPFLPPPSLTPNPDPIVADCFFVGEYNQIDTPNDLIAHVAWGDGRILTITTQQPQPDVFYSKLQQFVEPKPTPQPPVGGEFLPIDSTALLLAGMQTNSVWILSALAVVGITAFGALYISARRK